MQRGAHLTVPLSNFVSGIGTLDILEPGVVLAEGANVWILPSIISTVNMNNLALSYSTRQNTI